MGFDDDQHTRNGTCLVLGLGLANPQDSTTIPIPPNKAHHSFLTLGLFDNKGDDHHEENNNSQSAVSNSFSDGRVVKRERTDVSIEEADEVEKVVSNYSRVISDEDEDGANARKKLRLTKGQSALLEERFKVHSTLNPKQKQALARDLSLRPRQVEVWFQNRRARTKLKQTEVNCEFLKKCCENLSDENRRLQKEVQELKALKLSQQQPLFMNTPTANLTICPSCERIGGGAGSEDAKVNKSSLSVAHPKPSFYNPFIHSSAAC